MRGHDKLIALRLKGRKPRIVFVNDYPCDIDWFENPGSAVTVCTAGDDLQTIDLRFLVGLTVSVSSPTENRAKALFEACKRYAAVVAAGCCTGRNGWAAVWRRDTDTNNTETQGAL